MQPRSSLVALVSVLLLASCGKKEPDVKVQGGDPAGAPTMPAGNGNADYEAAKACCDALMASSTDPEEGGAFRRAGAACVTRAADVLTGNATKADVFSVVAPMVPAGKLPSTCQ